MHQLELENGGGGDKLSGGVGEADISGTVNGELVGAGDPRAHFPFEASINLDAEQHGSSVEILSQKLLQKRRNGDGVAVDQRRPDSDVAVALVGGRQGGGERDWLVAVRGVGVQFQVVNPNAAVRIPPRHRDLHCGCERHVLRWRR